MSHEDWDDVEEISKILEPFSHLTTFMQRETISLSDFFGNWAKIEMKIMKFPGSELAENLISEMKARKELLSNNPVLNAAVFLDPRYQKVMPDQNKENAIKYLEHLNEKLESLDAIVRDNAEQTNLESDEFAAFLNTVYGQTNGNQIVDENQTQPRITEETIRTKLKNFIGSSISIDSCIFEYWENNRHTQPELYKLASIVHAVPPTQTTVERAFSAMALVLTPLRTNLFDNILENILMLRLNREIFQTICEL